MSDGERLQAIRTDIVNEHRAWLELMTRIDRRRASERPPKGWSAVDTLVHVTAWRENGARVARLQAEPGAPVPGPDQGSASILGIDVEAFNAQMLDESMRLTAGEAIAEAERVHAELLDALTALPVDRILVPGGRGRHGSARWLGLTCMSHPAEHRRVLEQALTQP